MITLMGFGFILRSALLSYIYAPHLDVPAARWVYFAHGVLLFLYQTFYAVDGKQARQTNSSSPLGELFDHGCDALTCSFETTTFASSVMSGKLSFWFWVIATIPFYGATWESFFTDTLILPEVNGPTEGLLLIYLAHIFTAIVGPVWWTQNIKKAIPGLGMIPFVPDVSVTVVVVFLMMSVAVLPTVGCNFVNVHRVVRGRGTSFRLALAMLLPFWALLGVVFWGWISPEDIFRNQPHSLITGSGFAFAYLVGRLILAHLCEEPKGLKTGMCTALLYLPFAISNALSAQFFDGKPLVDETWVLVGYCAFTVSLYGHFAVSYSGNHRGTWHSLLQDWESKRRQRNLKRRTHLSLKAWEDLSGRLTEHSVVFALFSDPAERLSFPKLRSDYCSLFRTLQGQDSAGVGLRGIVVRVIGLRSVDTEEFCHCALWLQLQEVATLCIYGLILVHIISN